MRNTAIVVAMDAAEVVVVFEEAVVMPRIEIFEEAEEAEGLEVVLAEHSQETGSVALAISATSRETKCANSAKDAKVWVEPPW